LAQAIIDSKIDQNLLRCFSSFFSEKDKEDDVSVDAILSTFPVSYFHYRLMVVCGFAMLVYSMHLSHHARVILEVDPRDVASDAKVAALVLLMPMCEILSGPLWGCAADRYGRRPVTVYSLCFIALGSVVHLTSNAFPALVVAEMCVGLGAGAMSVPFDLLAEFFACPVRLRFLFCMSYCLFLGDVFVSLVYLGFFVEYGWRATSIAVTAFTLMVRALTFLLIASSEYAFLLLNLRTCFCILHTRPRRFAMCTSRRVPAGSS
jgi:MFS family permease